MEKDNIGIRIESVDPTILSHSAFVRINEVSQDMWASEEGLGELAQCFSCGKMLSKEAVFGHLPTEEFSRTVASIMQDAWMENIPCICCGGETRLVYGPENVDMIRKRVLSSIDSFLVLCRDSEDNIVWFEEGYIDSLDNIFEWDLAYHYRGVWLGEVKARVAHVLGYVPETMIIFSSIGFLKQYRNFPNLLEMLNQFSRAIPDGYMGIPGITELDRGNVIYKMGENLGVNLPLGIHEDPLLQEKIAPVGEKYDSNLIAYEAPVAVYKDNFTKGVKHFLKMSRRPKEGLVNLSHSQKETVAVANL